MECKSHDNKKLHIAQRDTESSVRSRVSSKGNSFYMQHSSFIVFSKSVFIIWSIWRLLLSLITVLSQRTKSLHHCCYCGRTCSLSLRVEFLNPGSLDAITHSFCAFLRLRLIAHKVGQSILCVLKLCVTTNIHSESGAIQILKQKIASSVCFVGLSGNITDTYSTIVRSRLYPIRECASWSGHVAESNAYKSSRSNDRVSEWTLHWVWNDWETGWQRTSSSSTTKFPVPDVRKFDIFMLSAFNYQPCHGIQSH